MGDRGALYVGKAGKGKLTIADGGTVTVNSSTAYVAHDNASTGTVVISGKDGAGNVSQLLIDRALVIGQHGTGSMSVLDGAIVDNEAGYIGASSDGIGVVTVSGPGSS